MADGKPSLPLAAIRELKGLTELLARITGEFDERPQVQVQVLNVVADPAWVEARTRLLAALCVRTRRRLVRLLQHWGRVSLMRDLATASERRESTPDFMRSVRDVDATVEPCRQLSFAWFFAFGCEGVGRSAFVVFVVFGIERGLGLFLHWRAHDGLLNGRGWRAALPSRSRVNRHEAAGLQGVAFSALCAVLEFERHVLTVLASSDTLAVAHV